MTSKALDPLSAQIEQRLPDRRAQRVALGGAVIGPVLIGTGLALSFGLSIDLLFSEILPVLLLVGAVAWALLYPALFAWWEYAQRRSTAHLNEPDFEVQLPVMEPLVLTLALLASVIVVLTRGWASGGLAVAAGVLAFAPMLLLTLGVLATLLTRPFAARVATERAYAQYLAGAKVSLQKNNARRARRLLERALGLGFEGERAVNLTRRREEAILAEAEHLRHRGRDEQADALVAELVAKPARTEPKSKRREAAPEARPTERRGSRIRSVSKAEVVEPGPESSIVPRLLPLDFELQPGEAPASKDPARRAVHDRAAALAARDRAREAVELLVEARLPLPRAWAEAAAAQYVSQGMLRSAFLLFERLEQEQIPEFYKAASVEWVRSKEPGPERIKLGVRLLDALASRGEHASAARVACQSALDPGAPEPLRRSMVERATRLFAEMGASLPPELEEARGASEAAARAYESEGRMDDARRCWAAHADEMIEASARPRDLIPVLSKIFHLDSNLDDRHLSPLVDHVVESNATGSLAQRILTAWRGRYPEDQRVGFRLFHLLVDAERADEALSELTRIAARQGSQPASLVDDFRSLVETFPGHFGAREGLVRMLIRSGKVAEATDEFERLIARGALVPGDEARIRRVRALVDSLSEWGSEDVRVPLLRGRVHLAEGDDRAASDAFELHVSGGGRDTEAIAHVRAGLEAQLVDGQGRPRMSMHAELARFLLAAGTGEAALPFLEALRGSPSHAEEASILIARLQLLGSEPESAISTLAGALGGRKPTSVPAICFELGRAYEGLGDFERARKADTALEKKHPGFAANYASSRPIVARSDGEDTTGVSPAMMLDGAFDDRTVNEGHEEIQAMVQAIDGTAVSPSSLGDALAPRYRLIRRLGSGGMGEVHLADDLVLGRQVAVKVLRRTLATDLFLAKFRDEARIVAQLSHPGIVGVFDIGQQGDWSFIVMEFVRGPNLATLLSAAVPPPRSKLVLDLASVADAMAYAHRRSVVHRDLKPANILVGVDGVVKVTDFGIARVLAGERGAETAFSAAGLQVGTANFMAPEQLTNDHADARTDIYLLSTTLFYSLARRYPFSGESAQIRKTRHEAPRISAVLPELSPALDELVARGLARDPQERLSSMEELAEGLRSCPEATPGEDATEAIHVE